MAKSWEIFPAQLFSLEMTLFLTKNITQNRKRFITQPKHMIFWYNKQFLKADDLLFLLKPKKIVFHFGRGPKFSSLVWPKVYQIFFRTARLQRKLLLLIESSNIFHWKSEKEGKWVWSSGHNLGHIRSNVVKKNKFGIINRLFSYFAWEIHLIARNSALEISEWKLKAKIARNATSKKD